MYKNKNTAGIRKVKELGQDITVYQNLLYKGKNLFNTEVASLPVKYTTKTSLVTKLKQAINNKLPTVALQLFTIANYYEQGVIDPKLQGTLKLCEAQSESKFLIKAFGEPEIADIPQLGEYHYYLKKIKMDEDEATDLVLRRLIDQNETKYSDFLNLGMILTNPDYFNEDLKEQHDTFFEIVVHRYLKNFVVDFRNPDKYQESLKKDFTKRYQYFAEGIKKWVFLDKDIKDKNLTKDVRSLAIKKNYPMIKNKEPKIILSKLHELYQYTDACYFKLCNNSYQFTG